eukprot:gene18501-24999_t
MPEGITKEPRFSWKDFLDEVSASDVSDDRAMELEKKASMQLQERLQGVDIRLLGSQSVLVSLSAAELNQCISNLDTDSDSSSRALVSLNNVLHLASPHLAAALVQHGVTEALVRGLHSRLGAMALTHQLAHMIVMLLWVMLIKVEALYGSEGADIMAQKSHVLELLISLIIFMANNPDELFTQLGLATAARSIRIMWGLTRHGTPACKAARSMCTSIGLLGRVTQLASGVPTEVQMPDPSGPPGCGPGGSLGELYISLLNVCSSFVASMMGLGGTLDVRSEALAPTRKWLLAEGQLDSLRAILVTLLAELHGHGRFLLHVTASEAPPQEGGASPTADAGSGDASSSGSMAQQVDGALRNLLTALGLPIMCASGQDDNAGEATALVECAMRYHHSLFQAGYVDVFKKLAAVTSYQGDYLTFFVAFSGVMLEPTLDIGEQFFKWGVQLGKATPPVDDFTGDADFSYLEGSGVNSEEAEEFIRERVMSIVDRAAHMRKVIDLGQRAMLAGRLLPKASQGVNLASLRNDPGTRPGTNLPMEALSLKGAATELTTCALCGSKESATGDSVMKQCPCKGVAYCGKTCQVAHFPSHKDSCAVVLAKRMDKIAKPAKK